MEHHVVGYGPEQNAFIVFKWVMIWLFACGLPCALSMALPRWVKVPGQDEHHHH